jgi:two-component system NtrC family sensor kinase
VTDFDEALPAIRGFPADLNKAILQLILNAAHAIAETPAAKNGGKGEISVRTRQIAEAAEITIADTGTGIPEKIRTRIFDPFFTTKGVGKGMGQGLYIAHTVVVEKHEGTITFDSRVGSGTTFTIRLPLTPAQPTAQAA